MEPNNPNNIQETIPESVPETKKSPLVMISSLLGKFKKNSSKEQPLVLSPEGVVGTPNVEPVATSAEAPKSKVPKVPKKIIIIIGVIVLALIVLALVVSMLSKNNGNGNLLTSTPSPVPTEEPTQDIPSQYADDEDVLELKNRMEELDRELNDSSFRDETLRIPNLDWNVSFE